MASLWLGIDCNVCSSDLLLAILGCSQLRSLLGFHFKKREILDPGMSIGVVDLEKYIFVELPDSSAS